jgi:putative aldouronate transport system substrate-binding protein
MAMPNPVVGAYSKTDASQGTALAQKMSDTVVGIAYGRDPIGKLDDAVKEWRAGGGERIRGEYEAALAAA